MAFLPLVGRSSCLHAGRHTLCAPSSRGVSFPLFLLLGPFLSPAEWPAHLRLPCGRTPIATGQIFWRAAPIEHYFRFFLLSLLLVRPLACCLLPALLSSRFLRCLLPVGCSFLPAFATQVIEVWEWVVKHRTFDPFLRTFPVDFVPSWFSMHVYLRSLGAGLCNCIPVSPLLLRRYSFVGEDNRPLDQSTSERSKLSKQ